MKNRANQCVAICVLILTAAVVQGQGPQKRGDRPASNTGAAAPAPPAAGLPSSSVAMMNTPQHSPDQLDFGSVADGSSVTRTFTLLTNSAGNITLTIPAGPFRVAEFREMGALSGGSKNLSAQPQPAAVSGVRSRIHYQEGQNGPYQWSMAPNVQMQVDIIFASKSQGMKIGGLKSAIMNVSGPGPQGNWVITVPLQGTIKTSSPESPQSPAINHGIVQLQSQRGGNSSAANAASLAGASSPAMRRPSMGQPVLFATKHRADLSPKGVDLKVLSQLQQQKQSAEAARTRITTASPRPAGGQTSKSMGSPTGTNAGIASPSVTSKPGGNDISLPPGLEVTEGLAMPAFVPVGEPMDLLVCPPAGRGLAVVIRVRAASALCFCCCSCESTLRSTPFGERSARCFVAKSTGWPMEGRRIAGEEAPAREAAFAADELPPLCD